MTEEGIPAFLRDKCVTKLDLEFSCSDAGTGDGPGELPPPHFWQISQPYFNQRGEGQTAQTLPTLYYWNPQFFSPSGISVLR